MRILLILLFVSFNGFSQTYDEIMSIKDVDAFKKVCIENGYEQLSAQKLIDMYEEEGEDYNEDSIKSDMERLAFYTHNDSHRAIYYYEEDVFSFQFTRQNWIGMIMDDYPYDKLLEDVKENCQYYKIITSPNGNDYVSYNCSQSLYKGKIGFRIEGTEGHIWNFPKE